MLLLLLKLNANCAFYFDDDYISILSETDINHYLLVVFCSFSYVVSYAQHGYGEPQRLTQSGFSHAVTLNEV